MKHVMTPVRLSDWLNALIMDATGDDILQVRAGRAAKDRSLEIVQAINEYDKLVAQRDALVDACKAHEAWKRHTERCRLCNVISGACARYDELGALADALTVNALALVRREDV